MICKKCYNKVSSDDKFRNNSEQKILEEEKNIVPDKPVMKDQDKKYFKESKSYEKRS